MNKDIPEEDKQKLQKEIRRMMTGPGIEANDENAKTITEWYLNKIAEKESRIKQLESQLKECYAKLSVQGD